MSTLIEEDKKTLRQRVTRLYGYQTSSKALAKAQALHVGGKYVSDIEEDTLVWSGHQRVEPPGKQGRRVRRKRSPRVRKSSQLSLPRRVIMPPIKGKQGSKRGLGSIVPKIAAVVQHYKGFVDAIHGGMAYLTLESRDGQRLELEWDARELAKKSIGERQPFILNTLTLGNTMRCDFVRDRDQPIPESLRKDINDLMSHYRSTNDLDDDDE